MEMAIFHTGGVFSYLHHHLDLALEDSVGHSTRMSVLARRRAIKGCVQLTSSRVRLGQSFKTVGYGSASCWGDVGPEV